MDFRFVLDTAVGEEQKKGYRFPDQPAKTVNREFSGKKDTILFYPFFIKAMTEPSSMYLSAWSRVTEEFRPSTKKLLNFRDIRTGEWDPAITYFYDMGRVRKTLNEIRFFVGFWEKPNRNYPRVKVFYPEQVSQEKQKVSFPLMVENNGDFEIEFLKIAVSSPALQNRIIQSVNRLKTGETKQIEVEGELKENVNTLKGDIEVKLWMGQSIFQQAFVLNIDAGREKELMEGGMKKVRPAEKKVRSVEKIRQSLQKINLLLYYINKGLDTGMSMQALEQLQRKVEELEREDSEKNTKN
jgi:hypothetical protein